MDGLPISTELRFELRRGGSGGGGVFRTGSGVVEVFLLAGSTALSLLFALSSPELASALFEASRISEAGGASFLVGLCNDEDLLEDLRPTRTRHLSMVLRSGTAGAVGDTKNIDFDFVVLKVFGGYARELGFFGFVGRGGGGGDLRAVLLVRKAGWTSVTSTALC